MLHRGRLGSLIALGAVAALWTSAAPPRLAGPHDHAAGVGHPSGAQVSSTLEEIRRFAGPRETVPPTVVTHRAGGVPAAAPAGLSTRLFRTGEMSLEPTIGIDANGFIYVQALEEPLASTVLRSHDNGRSWHDVTPRIGGVPVHSYTEDPYLYVDRTTGRVFHNDLQLPCHLTSASDNGGVTWSHRLHSCDQPDHQTIFAGPPAASDLGSYPNVVYMCTMTGGAASPTSTASSCDKSLDGGFTFEPTGSLAFMPDPGAGGSYGIPGACDGAHGHGFVGHDGTVYLPRGWCGQPWLAISRNEGATWERVQVASNGMPVRSDGILDHEASVAADANGNVYYFWLGRDRLPYLAVSRDGGKTWSAPKPTAPPGVKEAWGPSMAIAPGGALAFAYYASTNSPGPPFDEGRCHPIDNTLAFLSCAEPDFYRNVTWNGMMAITANPLDAAPLFRTVTMNDPADPLIRGTCGPFRCKAAYDFIDVQFAPDGSAWAPFVDGCVNPNRCTPLGELLVGRLIPDDD